MTSTDSFGGNLWVRPGRPRPHNLRSTRPDWTARLTLGLPAKRLPATLGSLLNLCGHAHIACADLAVSTALRRGEAMQHEGSPISPQVLARLTNETLREHLRRIWLDWPRHLTDTAEPMSNLDAPARELAGCPAFARTPSDASGWIEAHVLGMPPKAWLAAWQADPAAWLEAWCKRSDLLPARLLRGCRHVCDSTLPSARQLRVHADAQTMRDWAAGFTSDGSTAARLPHWQGKCAETGAWTRLNDPVAARLDTPWLRLGARIADVVQLADSQVLDVRPGSKAPADPARPWLSAGALPLAPREAVAWVEMSRGLLIHHVRLDGTGDDALVLACHVIAPTDWNFHPDGAVARALAVLPDEPASPARRRLDTLMSAYDPCVPFKEDQSMPVECNHA